MDCSFSIPIRLPYPRTQLTEVAHIEQRILDRILNLPKYEVEYAIWAWCDVKSGL